MLWALYNCIGPYLLLHYTYLGRADGLRVASSVGMTLALSLAVLAVALLVAFSPTSHDLAQVRTSAAERSCLSSHSRPGGTGLCTQFRSQPSLYLCTGSRCKTPAGIARSFWD